MKYINKKQKIILITIISIVTLAIAYYTYISKANEEFNVENQNLEIDEMKILIIMKILLKMKTKKKQKILKK